MPDLTLIYVSHCAQTKCVGKVISSKGDQYYDVTASLDERDDDCNCVGFKFRRHCSHVEQLRAKICGWNEQDSPEKQTPQQEMDGICPKCGGDIIVIRHGV